MMHHHACLRAFAKQQENEMFKPSKISRLLSSPLCVPQCRRRRTFFLRGKQIRECFRRRGLKRCSKARKDLRTGTLFQLINDSSP